MKKNFNFLGLGNKVFSYPIEIEKKHCILILNEGKENTTKRFLVDTGSPTSMAFDDFTFCGDRHHAHGTMLLNSVCELSGERQEAMYSLTIPIMRYVCHHVRLTFRVAQPNSILCWEWQSA